MSIVTVSEIKDYLRVIHSGDDALLQALIDAAEDEAVRFLNRTELPTLPLEYPSSSETEEVPSSGDEIAPSVRIAIYYWVQAKYEGTKPEDIAKLRTAGEVLLFPYRAALGV